MNHRSMETKCPVMSSVMCHPNPEIGIDCRPFAGFTPVFKSPNLFPPVTKGSKPL